VSGRDVSSQADQAAAQPVVRLVPLAVFEFDSGTVRITGAPYDMYYDLGGDGVAEEFRSLFGLGKVSGVEEGTDLQSYGITCSLSGIPPEAVSLALAEEPQGRPAYIYLALLDEGNRIIDSPLCIFAGRMDVMPIKYGATAEINLAVSSRLADWDRIRGGRYTDAEQQSRCPGDRIFQFSAQACDTDLTWGKS